MFRNKFAD
jgi:hypothetical protein